MKIVSKRNAKEIDLQFVCARRRFVLIYSSYPLSILDKLTFGIESESTRNDKCFDAIVRVYYAPQPVSSNRFPIVKGSGKISVACWLTRARVFIRIRMKQWSMPSVDIDAVDIE